MSVQNDIERITDKLQRGLITSGEANVEMVLVERFRIVKVKMPRAVRKALNEAVKIGTLGHLKKEGLKPEVYFHPTFDHLAKNARNEDERNARSAIAGCFK